MYPLRPKQGVIKARYLLALLLGEHFTSVAVSRCVRTGIPKINRVELGEYIAPIPEHGRAGRDQPSNWKNSILHTECPVLKNKRCRLSMILRNANGIFGGELL